MISQHGGTSYHEKTNGDKSIEMIQEFLDGLVIAEMTTMLAMSKKLKYWYWTCREER